MCPKSITNYKEAIDSANVLDIEGHAITDFEDNSKVLECPN